MENYVQFTMRMDKDLYEELKQSAKLNRRSIAKELENMVDICLHKENIVDLPADIANKLFAFLEKQETASKDK